MEHIQIPERVIDYPVGSNIASLKELVQLYAEGFLKIGYYHDTKINLWCRGSSGAILATAFSLHPSLQMYEFYICHVKKIGESAHSSPMWAKVSGAVNIIIDDFVSSGETVNAIIGYMTEIDEIPQVLIVSTGGKKIGYPFTYLISSS